MTPYQLKAARTLLGWSRLHLALHSATSEHIVTTYEKTGRVAGLHDRTKRDDPIAAIRATLEAAGVEFFNARTPGARMRPRPMTPDQMKAARTLLGWSIDRLSVYSGTSIHMVGTFEHTGRVTPLYVRERPTDAVAAVRATLETAGIEFTNGDAPGVRLRKQSS